ncbi:MAG: DEAD/DEAH box helicase [Candidatus Aenigmarchaeota archaeon]|nr:DEAD/DEAH box helicase [Candidatus Aenigmarchaeota archaeon]
MFDKLYEELSLPKEFVDRIGIEKLNPVQKEAVKKGLLKGKNLVVASPTASGKTVVAEIAMIKHFLNHGKIVYLVPLKALASEKYKEFKKKYSDLGLKVAISVGDYDSSAGWLGKYDVIICTNEKMDSLIRHQTNWINKISLIVTDEIHLLNDYGRGPIIEFVLTQLRRLTNAQIISLSATISNANEIAEWLDSSLVKVDYRPVKLHKGVLYQSNTGEEIEYTIDFLEKGNKKIFGKDGEIALCKDVLEMEKQALVFLSTRRSAEAVAEKLMKITDQYLKGEERTKLGKIANQIENELPNPTKQCKKLANIVRRGSAFHHAGLMQKQRDVIEEGFKAGLIKTLSSTVTLAYGVNIPAYRVVIRDVKRFTGYGSDFIPVLDVLQMAGRAGRPAYDDSGEAVIIARTDGEAEELKERYFLSDTEPIESKLESEPILRMYSLVLIASQVTNSKSQLNDFFKRTFYAHQNDFDSIERQLESVIKQLQEFGFVENNKSNIVKKDLLKDHPYLNEFVPAFEVNKDEDLKATKIGKRVSELYIDPLSAWEMIKNIKDDSDIEYLMTINKCVEMKPLLRVKKDEYEELGESTSIMKNVPDVWDVDYSEFLSSFKTVMLFTDWIEERTEDQMLEKFDIPPGELYTKIRSAEWMLYSYKELAMIVEKKNVANRLNKLSLRIKHGVREDLLKLVVLKGIGRARARKLWHAKIRTTDDIKKVKPDILAEILGPAIAKKVKEEAQSGKNI